MKPFRSSHIEIDRKAIEHNINFIRNRLEPNVIFSSVVKGNAYGHGIEMMVPILQSLGQGHFSVFSADEAYRVQKIIDSKARIMIMGKVAEEELKWAIENGIEFYVFDSYRLDEALACAQKIGRAAKIHIELETGMNRTGFLEDQIDDLLTTLEENSRFLKFMGLCTHLAGAESISNYLRVRSQFYKFNSYYERFEARGLIPAERHIACSAAFLRYPKSHMDMVRCGILQYGLFPNRETFVDYAVKSETKEEPINRVLSWKSRVMDVKEVKSGEYIGYGTSYLANEDMTIASIPVGYSHGFSRALSNKGRVLIHGERVPVIGTVNMNMMTVDISGLTGVSKGDEAVLIGKQGEREISVASFGEYSELLNYELLTRLPSEIPRTVVNQS